MTGEDIKKLIEIYKLIFRDYLPNKVDENIHVDFNMDKDIVFSHLCYMMDEINKFIEEGRIDKAFR